jgi:hypothetical protein
LFADLIMKKFLKADKHFTPCPVTDDDELFPNGFFVFNITRLREDIRNNPDRYILEVAAVRDFPREFSFINQDHLDSVDIFIPVVLAEIAPGQYNLIDGHHRMEKARRMGITSVPAYRLEVEQHIRFLTSTKAYTTSRTGDLCRVKTELFRANRRAIEPSRPQSLPSILFGQGVIFDDHVQKAVIKGGKIDELQTVSNQSASGIFGTAAFRIGKNKTGGEGAHDEAVFFGYEVEDDQFACQGAFLAFRENADAFPV